MKINTAEHSIHITTVALQGRIDAFTAPTVREKIFKLLDDGIINLVIDLRKVPFLDSAAIAVLVNSLKRARKIGGDVKLVLPESTQARRLFSLTKFDRVFDITETAVDARNLFGGVS